MVGPGFDNPFSRYFQRKLVIIPRNGEPFQFVHEDDLIEIIYRLISERRGGVYNVGGDSAVAPEEMVRMMGNIPIRIPYGLLYVLNRVAWLLRLTFLTEFPSPALQMIRYPWIVSSEKLKSEIGYSYKFTSREAFQDFVSHLETKKS